MATFYLKKGDTLPVVDAKLGSLATGAEDLTGATVLFRLRKRGASTNAISAPAAIVSPTEGTVRYSWIDGDTTSLGIYDGEFVVTFSDGKVKTFPNNGYFIIEITANLS